MRFILYNHIGSANHGCEALVRTVPQLFKPAESILLSDSPEEDKAYLKDSCIDMIAARQEDTFSVLPFVIAYLKLKLMHQYFDMDILPYRPVRKKLLKTDVLVSIGGDIFCYENYPKYILLHQYFLKTARHSLLIGCSIEPERLNDSRLLKDLRSFDLITAREHLTLNALKKAGLKKIWFCPDTAFNLPARKTDLPKAFISGQTIGINVSPLILKKAGKDSRIMESLHYLIQKILEMTSFSVAFIPHVVTADNDDREPLSQLYESFKTSKRACLIEDRSAPELKWIISKCRYFIGARTHAVIAAYSTGVPTIALGYSVKSRGIAKDLFGTGKHYVLHYSKISRKEYLYENWQRLTEHEENIREILLTKTADYQKQIEVVGHFIRKMYIKGEL